MFLFVRNKETAIERCSEIKLLRKFLKVPWEKLVVESTFSKNQVCYSFASNFPVCLNSVSEDLGDKEFPIET